jgi:3-oxoacid CoA-transferase B subunit
MPTGVLPYVPSELDIIFHSEQGIVGMGPELTDQTQGDNDLLNASKRRVSLIPGAAFVNHVDSFAIARGGHLDAAILGAYQVAENGDLANWKLPGARLGSIGGAMDIAVGARRVFAMMTHVTREGAPKIVPAVTYPLTAARCVTKIFTDLAVIAVTARGLEVQSIAPGVSFAELQAATGAPLVTPRA